MSDNVLVELFDVSADSAEFATCLRSDYKVWPTARLERRAIRSVSEIKMRPVLKPLNDSY